MRHLLAILACVALLAAPAFAQRNKGPRNDPARCPWCHADPVLMQAAGIVNHGGFEFGSKDTAWADKFFGGKDIYWIESEHFQIGLLVTAQKIPTKESKKIRAELSELAEVLPDVEPKTRILEPFMRAHLYAQRMEHTWDRFLEVMQVQESSFPGANQSWLIGTPYWGEGPYLGHKGKFEILVLPTSSDQVGFLRKQFGLSIKRTQRWNVLDRSSLIVVTNLAENELRDDARLHGHLVFNMAINMLDAFKHYSYETPHWLREGLGHLMEREINPRYNTYDASEGSIGVKVNKRDWDAEVKRLISSGEAPRLAEMIGLRAYAEFELRHHYASWSMTRFMVESTPGGYGCLSGKIHGRKSPDGFPDSEDLNGVHREAIKSCFGMSYPQFDEAWRAWATSQ